MPDEATLRLVRELHALIENVVRENGGVVDKYIGDGAMVALAICNGPRSCGGTRSAGLVNH
jgi:class 3 adenylate cyclase